MDTKISLISGIIGGVVTIITSVGGAYMTTKLTLAKHDFEIEALKTVTKGNSEILHRIDKSVAVIEERTKK